MSINFDLLKRLCETPGVPGREERVCELIKGEIEGLFDEVRTDALGNLICTRRPRTGKKLKKLGKEKAQRVMLLCHMDEIGFYVTAIDDRGFLWMNAAGGFDTRNLFSRRVTVVTDTGDINGVMNPGGRPIHISGPKDREKIPEVKEFFVDIGLPGDQVKKKVKVGDYVVMNEPWSPRLWIIALPAGWASRQSVSSTRAARGTPAKWLSRLRPRKKLVSAEPRLRAMRCSLILVWASM